VILGFSLVEPGFIVTSVVADVRNYVVSGYFFSFGLYDGSKRD
jgi:hypothetical protein